MLSLYQLFVDRLKAVVLAGVGLELETDILGQQAARKADLFRLANQYEEEGLTQVAEELRSSLETLEPDQPLAQSLPVTANLVATQGELETLGTASPTGDCSKGNTTSTLADRSLLAAECHNNGAESSLEKEGVSNSKPKSRSRKSKKH